MQGNNCFSNNVALKMFIIVANPTPNAITFIYCKNVKSSTKSYPNDNALQSQSSKAEYSRFMWGAEQNLCC